MNIIEQVVIGQYYYDQINRLYDIFSQIYFTYYFVNTEKFYNL